MTPPIRFRLLLMVILCVLCVSVVNLFAQDAQCGDVDALDYPVDPNSFQIVQGFGAPSPRHNGRYHTGEDWFGGAEAFGQPVRAVARGRVTYSSPTVWGRDGGVVIIEHTMPDGTTVYTMYGHIIERGDITFPARFSCVQLGDMVGAVGDIRPAPHVHWEIRTSGADLPGTGYAWEDPRVLGFRDPSAFVTDWQARLSAASQWFVEFADAPLAPPLVLDDNSLLMLNGVFLRRVLPDGRILWRVTLEQPAVAVVGFEGAPLLLLANGTMQRVDYDGNFGESWQVDARFDSPPIESGDNHILHTPDNALVAMDRQWRNVVWRTADVPPFLRAVGHPEVFALVTARYELLIFSSGGILVNRAQLRGMPGLSAEEGGISVFTRLGLWNVYDGWGQIIVPLPARTESLAIAGRARFDGQTLFVSTEVSLPDVTGSVILGFYALDVLLLSTGGSIILVNYQDAAVCGSLRLWRDDDNALLWHNLGDDGVLRVLIGRRLLGLEWDVFNSCLN